MSNPRQSMSRRSPSILVTDARHGSHTSAPFVRSGGFAKDRRSGTNHSQPQHQRTSSSQLSSSSSNYMHPQAAGQFASSGRFDAISIDNILSDVSEIPSAQRRNQGHPHGRYDSINEPNTPSISPPLDKDRSKAKGKGNKTSATGSQAHGQGSRPLPRLTPTIQGRTTKLSEKLVLIPEEGKPNFKFEDESDNEDDRPPRPRQEGEDDTSGRRRSYAERIPKDRRTDQFGRVTAYCISDAVRLKAAAEFLRENHKIRPRIYDEALFAPYYLPLLPGDDGGQSRVKSSPQGLAHMERLINESEQGDHHYEYFSGRESGQEGEQPVEAHDMHDGWTPEGEEFDPSEPQDFTPPRSSGEWMPHDENDESDPQQQDTTEEEAQPERPASPPLAPQEEELSEIIKQDEASTKPHEPPPNEKHAEMFIFTYGVVVFWNFSEKQERDILADLTFARIELSPENVKSLVVRPIDDQDIETEELHFAYSPETSRPRIYNDMITLKSGDHMIKLGMSHAIAQSTKLSRFEARMDVNMHDVKHVPKMLALTGKLGMKREEVLKISGKLFKLRVDVNLSSNVLDTPEFFWEDEPSLNPLYTAVREYLEIEQRILVINERCKVFLELTDIIADSIAEGNMSRITWIIIILIALSLGVSMMEIFIRYTILEGRE